jgi:asparagine synthase (glutamine-hydrolysing)
MCGIFGVFGSLFSNVIDNKDYTQFIRHRGPDDRGSWINKQFNICLCHTRLSILDLSSDGSQPMVSDDDRYVLVYNGEIYNCQTLRNELLEKGYIFRGASDTEVLLQLFLSDGMKMLTKLNGIFSFAIWDNHEEKLFIARDALGVKPLYYALVDNSIVFSSEIKAILPLLHSNQKVDVNALQKYLTFLWSPGEQSPVKAIKKLSPGEALLISNTVGVKKWCWYKLPFFKQRKMISDEKSKIIIDVATHLRNAVHKQLLSDVPVGSFLSGGLDSSAIVAFANELKHDIPCFTIKTNGVQESGFIDDFPYAEKVANYLNVPLHVVSIDASKMASDIENMVAMLDEPLADPAALNVLYICRLAKENGIKVLLSGAGGDDLFTGYRRHYATNLDQWLKLIPTGLRSMIERSSQSLNMSNSFYRRLAKLFKGSSLVGDEKIINYFRWADKNLIQSLFTQEVREEMEGVDSAEVMFDFLGELPKNTGDLERMLALEQRFFLSDHNLIYTDKMSMASGVEVRVPFLDHDLVEFASRIPIKYKQRGSVGKWVLKKAMEPYLPKDIIYRPKTGFGAPLRRWIKFELSELLTDLLSEESLLKRGIFDTNAVHKLIESNESGRIDASYTLFSLMCIEIWCRQYLDKQFNYQRVYSGF